MDDFTYQNGELLCERLAARDIAERVATPSYVYSAATLTGHHDRLTRAFAPLHPTICFSVKSCPNTHLLRLLAQRGSGFDVVSGGELFRARRAGADMTKIVYAGVGKTDAEIDAALAAGIGLFNVESAGELDTLAARCARARAAARIARQPGRRRPHPPPHHHRHPRDQVRRAVR
ncbi:MAG: hypothetical protein U1A27_13950 [Phycisphaerae bacterium]